MKKLLSLLMVMLLTLSLFVGCGDEPVTPEAPTEKDYSLAMGVVVSPALATSKVTATVASIVTDADGKIVLCKFDCVDYSAWNKTAGAINTTAPQSKLEQGDAYDSYMPMEAGRWYQQAGELEAYVVGKTQAEVAATALNADGKVTDTDLYASCSIAVTDLLGAVDNAFKSEHKVSFKSTATAFTAGISVVGSVKDTSKEATDETPASTNAKYSVTFAGAVLADGKVVASILDTAEPELIGITADGAESLSYKGSKREQGDAYDAWQPMAAGRWYSQADAYSASAVGLTAQNIDSLKTEGVAGCTITVTDYKAAIEKAVKAAK